MSVTELHPYLVQVFRRDGHWILEVPELRAVGQARTLTSAGSTARELVALWLDVPADQVQVVLGLQPYRSGGRCVGGWGAR